MMKANWVVKALKKSSKVLNAFSSITPVSGPSFQFISGCLPLFSAISRAATMFII